MTTLVTGATGLLGNNLVRLLLEQGADVRVLVRPQSDLRSLAGLDVQVIEGDVRDATAVDAACHGVQRVLHAAARVHIGWSGSQHLWSVNVDGTRNVCSAARKVGARMVHVSSVDALNPGKLEAPGTEESPAACPVDCPYVLTKRSAEQVVLEAVGHDLDAVIVNPAFLLGPWDWKPSSGKMLISVASNWGIFAPPGGNDFCDVRDVATGIMLAAQHGRVGQRYILGGHSWSYLEAWRLFARVTGAFSPLRAVRPWFLRSMGAIGDLAGWVRGREGDFNSAATALSMLPRHSSSARAIAELGYSFRPLEVTVRDAWHWFQEHGHILARQKSPQTDSAWS